jgi:mono/diheme cytochrome c family protein
MPNRSSQIKALFGFFVLFMLSACNVLNVDVTPPPGYFPTAENTPQPARTVYPLVPPDPVQGAQIYDEKCASCHGLAGNGDGDQAARLSNPPTALGVPEIARNAKPVDWFGVITGGRLDQSMPGFSSSLSDRQRWDVVAYLFSLSMTPDELEQGRALYQEKCLACHGVKGRGDGPQAASLEGKVPDWYDGANLTEHSAKDIYQIIAQGSALMPAFVDQLNDSQRWSVASYVRSLTFARANTSQSISNAYPAERPQASSGTSTPAVDQTVLPGTEAAPVTITIKGQVINGSGSILPEGLKVRVQAFDDMTLSFSTEVGLLRDGSYRVPDIALKDGRVFLASVDYQGITFSSEALHAADISGGDEVDLPILVYEADTDISALAVDRLHIFFDFSNPDKVQVVELYILSNASNKVVTASQAGQPVLQFNLPEGYQNLQFQEGSLGDRYVRTDSGFGDTQPVQPGTSSQILFAFDLPYTDKATVMVVPPLPVQAVVVMAPVGSVHLQSSMLKEAGQKDVKGSKVALYTGSKLAAGSELDLNLSGKPGSASPTATTVQAEDNISLAIGLGVFGLALIGLGFWMYQKRGVSKTVEESQPAAPQADESVDALLDEIVALDDQYEAGQIPQEAYQQRRAELKEQLHAARMRNRGDAG